MNGFQVGACQAIHKNEMSEEEFHKRLMRAAQGSGSPVSGTTSTSVDKISRLHNAQFAHSMVIKYLQKAGKPKQLNAC